MKHDTAETITVTGTASSGSGLTDATKSLTVTAAAHRYWELYITASDGGANVSISEMKLYWAGSWHSLTGLTLTQSGGSTASYPLSKINDGTAETSNGSNMWSSAAVNVGIIIDLGTAQVVEGVAMAPQGTINSVAYNTPKTFTLYSGDSNTGPWNSVNSYSNVTAGYPAWNAGTLRTFMWSAATKISIANTSVGTSICSQLSLNLVDVGDNSATASAATTINLTTNGSGAFYSSSSCTGGSVITSVSNVSTTASFYFKDDTQETKTIYATDAAVF